ncbi:MAG: hypothetical protein ACO4B0_16735 [bacterium]
MQSSSGCDLTTLVEGYLALEASLELPTLRTQLLEASIIEQFQQAGTPDLIMLTVAVQRLQAIS